MDEPQKNFWQRLIFRVGVALVLVIGLYWIYASWSLNPYIKQRLQETVRQETNGAAQLTVESVSTNLFKRSVTLRNPRIQSASADTSNTYLNAESLVMGGIHLLDYWWSGNIRVNWVNVIRPFLKLQRRDLKKVRRILSNNPDGGSVVDWFIQRASMRGGAVQMVDEEGQATFKLNRIDITFTKLHQAKNGGDSLPVAFQQVEWTVNEGSYQFQNGLYEVKVDKAQCNSVKKACSGKSVQLIPQLPRHTFSRRVGHETDRVDLKIPIIRASGIDVKQLINGNIDANKLLIQGADLVVFHDKARPPDTTTKVFPHVGLLKLPAAIEVDSVKMENTTITYLEQREEIAHPGRITFSDIAAVIEGVTNDPEKIENKQAIQLEVQTRIMDAANLTLNVHFPLYEKGRHRLRGSMEQLQLDNLNPIFEPLELLRIEAGVIQSLDFKMMLGAQQATGKVRMKYQDLKIELLNKGDIGDEGHRVVASLLANALKVKSENQKPLRVGEVSAQRNTKRSMFNYWWKSLASGLKHSIGL